METFSLKGLHYSVATPMHICPQVQDRCCTNMDQLRILKLWNSIGRVTTRMHNANLFQTYLGTFKYIQKIIPELDESNIIVTFIKHQWIPYIKHYCGQTSEVEVDADEAISRLIPGEGKWVKWDKIIPKEEQKKKLMDEIDKITVNQYLRIVAHFTPIWYQHFDEMENYYYSEVDLKSIRVKELFTQGVNFQHEKNYFLYFLQIAANALIDIYQKTDSYYTGKVKKAKLISYQETFLKEYKNFMVEAEAFMMAYNKMDCPVKRYTELHIYAQLCKDRIKRMLEGIVLREKYLYLSLAEFKREKKKMEEDEEKRKRFKKAYQDSKDSSKFKAMMAEVRDEHQQFIKEQENGGKDSLNGMSSDDYFTSQYQAKEKEHGMVLPAEKLRKLGQKVVRKQLLKTGLADRNLRRKIKIKLRRRKKKKRKSRFRRKKKVLKDERLDFPSVALQEIIKFRKKSIKYALNVRYKKDIFWKNLIQSFVNTRYDFTPKQMPIVITRKIKRRRGKKRKFYLFDQKQEYFFGIQKRRPNYLFNALEHPARFKRLIDSKLKFKKLEKFHRKQRFVPFTLNDRLFQVKNIKLPFKQSAPNEFECQIRGQHFYRSLMVQNKSKVQYCYRMIRNLKEEPIDMIIQEIQKQISANLNILDLKKTIYCAVCDPNSQQLFHAPKKIIIYEEKFCYNLINMHHAYLSLMHVTLVEFIFKILQTLQCLKSTGEVNQLPFDTILDKRMRRVQFIKNCLENSEGSDFMKYCYNVCQQINMLGFSKFWDGDVQEIQEIFVKVRSFATKMEVQPIPEVDQLEYKIPSVLIRDSFKGIHSRGEGYDQGELDQQEQDEGYLKIKQEQAFIVNQTETSASQNSKKPTNAAEKIPEPLQEDTPEYQELCKQCPFGDDGINCRVQYCKKPTPCQMCQEGPDGTLCREKYCEFFSSFTKKYKQQQFDTSKEHQPQSVNSEELVTLMPKAVIQQKRFPKVHSRGLENFNKITSEDTQINEGRILALDDNDQSLRKEIYQKKLPLYNVQGYRNFFSANRYALNPLKLIRNVAFDEITPKELFKRQMDQFKNNSIQPEVVKDFLNIGKKKVKSFNKDIKIMFNPVVSSAKKHLRKSKALKKKLKHIRYIKNLKKTTVELELHRPYKYKYKLKKMPPYSFLLDDIGKNSNDPASKVMLGKVVRIFKDPKDPRDAVKRFKKKSKGKKKKEIKISTQLQFI